MTFKELLSCINQEQGLWTCLTFELFWIILSIDTHWQQNTLTHTPLQCPRGREPPRCLFSLLRVLILHRTSRCCSCSKHHSGVSSPHGSTGNKPDRSRLYAWRFKWDYWFYSDLLSTTLRRSCLLITVLWVSLKNYKWAHKKLVVFVDGEKKGQVTSCRCRSL